ncbi:hypothetical protein BpHYR1_050415 [Brachionus plicatilis]|uniref:Uncharacterized protein n=1 Tax=Brachionus plicatilis TaxID=10195 RepID=A0A3M7RLH4_BRAPC|nr:hypothetical protein BpHYR1_050415 [Brachionus plicatilis]
MQFLQNHRCCIYQNSVNSGILKFRIIKIRSKNQKQVLIFFIEKFNAEIDCHFIIIARNEHRDELITRCVHRKILDTERIFNSRIETLHSDLTNSSAKLLAIGFV